MKLQGRILSNGTRGDDVRLLHRELVLLGFRNIPDSETRFGMFGPHTLFAVRDFQKNAGLPVTGVVDERTARAINERVDAPPEPPDDDKPPETAPRRVRGFVTTAGGRPVANVTVRAFDRDLRSEQLLGEKKTGPQGDYEITYTAEKFQRADKGAADLVVRALPDNAPPVDSPILFNSGPDEMIDLVLAAPDSSEYELLVEEIRPLVENLPLADLQEDDEHKDVSFLAGETGRDATQIAFLILAHRHNRRLDVPPAAYYGLFRQGMPTGLAALVQQPVLQLEAALRATARGNVIPPALESRAKDLAGQLVAQGVKDSLHGEDESTPSPLGAVLSLALPDKDLQTQFLAAFVAHEGPPEELWHKLARTPEFSDPQRREKLQLTLQLGTLTGNHAPLVGHLIHLRDTHEIRELRDLAGFSADRWEQLVSAAGGPPADTPGQTSEEKLRRYARTLEVATEDAFPTAAIARRMEADPQLGGSPAARFLAANADFDLRTANLDKLFTGAQTDLKRDLQGLQRVFKIAPRFTEMKALVETGVDSAHAVTRMGRNAFLNEYAPKMGNARARIVYKKAAQAAATALNLLAEYAPVFHGIDLQVLPDLTPKKMDGVPDWETLFGSGDYCECDHCRSVLSPAAYLVDVLAFLHDRPSRTAGRSAKAVLFQRRPDLGEIELTCENTNTLLPYVDLVNEILESAIAPATAIPARQRQTTGPASELAANPQHVNPGAYAKLGDAVFPWSLPFDLWLEEARAYLAHLGVPRHQLMETFRRATPTAPEIAAERLGLSTVERRILTGEALVPPRDPWELYGFSDAESGTWTVTVSRVRAFLDRTGLTYDELTELLTLRFIDPGHTLVIESDDPEDPNTCDTAKLVVRNLDTAALDRILRFVRLWRRLGWTMRDVDRAIAALRPATLDDDLLRELAAVERLARELDLPVPRLLTFYALLDTHIYGDGSVDKPLYDELFLSPAVVKLEPGEADSFALKPDRSDVLVEGDLGEKKVTAALLGTLSVAEDELAALVSGPDAVVTADKKLNRANLSRLARHVFLARALRLRIPDLLRLVRLSGIDPFATTGAVTPVVLQTTLDFVATVGKLAEPDFTVAEVDLLLGGRADAASPATPADEALSRVLDDVRAGLQGIIEATSELSDEKGDHTRRQLALLRWDAGLVEEALGTLLGNLTYTAPLDALPAVTFPEPLASRVAWDDDTKLLRFSGPMTVPQRTALMALSADGPYQAAVQALFDVPRDFVTGRMKAFVIPTFSASLHLAALPAGIDVPKNLRKKVYHDATEGELKFNGYMTATEKKALADLAADADWTAAVDALFAAPAAFVPAAGNTFLTAADAAALFDATISAADRLGRVLARVMPYLRRTLSEALVLQKVGAALGVEPATGEALLGTRLRSLANAGEPLLRDFLAPAFVTSDPAVKITRAAFPGPLQALALAFRAAFVATKLRVNARQMPWVFGRAATAGWLDLNDLPLASVADPSPRFSAFVRLLDLARLRDGLRQGEAVLTRVFELAYGGGSAAGLLGALAEGAGWSRDDLEHLAGASGFNLALPAAFQSEQALLRLQAAFTLLRRLGVSAERGLAWTAADPAQEHARGIRQTAKAKYETADWLAVAGPLRNTIRARQRAALVAYLVARPGAGQSWRDANDLYQHFLIDVEMAPCQLTSRIKQALSSVQLFVQRCLLSLESEVDASAAVDVRWREWKWMKNYRVWEANRKVFLYPENWIEPDLRDDKTPFFKELENDLLQKELTDETAEEAFLKYLEKLDAVARLEVAATYHHLEKDTQGNPAVDELHVFARTRSTPHIYYHRIRVDSYHWTAWQKLDLDIEGDHLIPFVWNRRLHLFWLVFSLESEPQPITMPSTGQTLPEPLKFWRIQLSWSERRNGKWQPRQISRESLESYHDFRLPRLGRFFAKPWVQEDSGDLWIAVLSMNEEPGQQLDRSLLIGAFILGGCSRTVHSVDGRYFPTIKPGLVIRPDRTWVQAMEFVERNATTEPLFLPVGESSEERMPPQAPSFVQVPVLNTTPGFGPFHLLASPQYYYFVSQDACFFSDSSRTFFVVPEDVWVPSSWTNPGGISLWIDPKLPFYYQEQPWFEDPLGDPFDPRLNPLEEKLFGDLVTVGHTPGFLAQAAATLPANPLAGPLKTQGLDQLLAPSPAAGGMAGGSARFSGFTSAAAALTSAPSGQSFENTLFTDITLAQQGFAPSIVDLLAPVPQITTGKLWLGHRERRFRFYPFYHPYTCLFIRELNRFGLDGILQRPIQVEPESFLHPPRAFNFDETYDPASVVLTPYPAEDVDFDVRGPYAQYNWELFFHAPLQIAVRLCKNQRFEEAQRWFHTIFDPTDTSSHPAPQRYWRTRPFFLTSTPTYREQQIEKLLQKLASGTPDQDLEQSVREWRKDPFNPHAIARLRTNAFQKTVVMKYLDNLIAWGDQLFRRDTIESINEASQLYVLAAEILGRRPQGSKRRAASTPKTYNDLEPRLDEFSNALVAAELLAPEAGGDLALPEQPLPPVTLPTLLYFCVPKNDKLLGYWDLVADRLFKIRHCQNIEGVERQLALFEPPIDPALLVRAAASGLDLGAVLADVNAALPHYRFSTMAAKAAELCGEVKSLGAALLAALEKRDAEALSLLRSSQEIRVLEAAREVRRKQIDEAQETIAGLERSKELAQIKRSYYASRDFMNAGEKKHSELAGSAVDLQIAASVVDTTASVTSLIPNFKIGSPFSLGVTFGGHNVGDSLKGVAGSLSLIAGTLNASGSVAATLAGYDRRADEWRLQDGLAAKEIAQIDRQIAAAKVRLAIAERELDNHDLQVENAKEAEAFLQGKFTNRELYDWMVSQISGVYFQSYQLAYDVAKRAEQAYRFELALDTSAFVQFGYWDSLKKGLLAGEKLSQDLKRMEISYLDENRREYEITRRVSLALLDPMALSKLKETGECFVTLPETLFDLDAPGHYLRRLKSVGLTIPCVAGPYTGVHCTLTLLRSSVRRESRLLANKYARQDNDPRFKDASGSIQSIVTSGAADDAGLFETSLRDERYLPFEGAGAISEWHLRLPPTDFRSFDYDSITDVVLHLRYTAREGGSALREPLLGELRQAVNALVLSEGRKGLFLAVSARHAFPSEWSRFMNPAGDNDQVLSLDLTRDRFPLLVRDRKIRVDSARLLLHLKHGRKTAGTGTWIEAYAAGDPLSVTLAPPSPSDAPQTGELASSEHLMKGQPSLTLSVIHDVGTPFTWTLTAARADIAAIAAEIRTEDNRLQPAVVEDLQLVLHYTIE